MKRAFDVLLVVLSAPLGLLLIALVALAMRLRMGGPVFFCQVRPGLRGQPFPLLKFRTMRTGAGSDAERLTPFGRWLRRTSLDELPELLNVLKGDMSLVGPRPLLMAYLPRYTPEQARRHEVRPGLTGWAQVHGRNAQSWDERLKLDVWYVDHHNLMLDLRILALTVWQVLAGRGIRAAGHATMPEFRGQSLTEAQRPQRREDGPAAE